LRFFFWLFAELESSLEEFAKALAEALAGAAEQREADFTAMSEAISDVYRVLGSGDVPSVSEGYCLPDEDEAALAEIQRLDAVAAGPSAVLATTFEAEILPPAPSPEAEMDLTEGGDGAEGATPSQGDA
jgi:hypothetical protein